MAHVARVIRVRRGIPLPPEVRALLLAAIERDGLAATCRRLGLARAGVATAAAGLPVLLGTGLVIATRLEGYQPL